MEFCEKQKIQICENITMEYFYKDLYHKRTPVILRGVDIGLCKTKWSVEYLSKIIGIHDVKIHVCQSNLMDFINKNFMYRSLPFDQFIKRAAEDEHEEYFLSPNEFYYLRTIGQNPRKDVADIRVQFPELENDIAWPSIIPDEKIFSTVFRIASANVSLWTHYDIMDNLLIQIKGRKQAVLFPPDDAINLYLNGDKSEILDIHNPDLTKYPKFSDVHWYEEIMEEGDILFIPALWFHNMTALDFGIAINIFWKNLPDSLYDKKDPYGNKDLIPAQKALTSLQKILMSLEELPDTYYNFYCSRLIQQIQEKIKVT